MSVSAGELFAVAIAFMVGLWVYNDAKKRGSDKAFLWFLGVFLLLIVFLPIWLTVRPEIRKLSGERGTCFRCGRFYAESDSRCPGCGLELRKPTERGR